MENNSFLEYKKSLEKEPIGDVKKRYVVGCRSGDDWKYIHEHLLEDGTLEDNIPTDPCECVDEKLHSSTRGIYLLTEYEASLLRNDPRVTYVHIDASYYKGTYLPDPKLLIENKRYTNAVKNYRGSESWQNNNLSSLTPTSSDNHRTGYHLHRTSQKLDPWNIFSKTFTDSSRNDANQVISSNLTYNNGTGIDVDLIVGDTRCWFGHIEFQNNLDGPIDYVGGNVLKSGFSNSSLSGSCDLLDLILDAPYYLDPTFFESSPNTLLTTRWDGTKVPTDQAARDWWGSASYRSSLNVLGGATVNIISAYTRENCNGSHTSNPATDTSGEYHGTACASQAYGRTHGWAFNSNKWYINVYGEDGCGIEEYFDIVKLFHQYKPNRPSDNTKNPTICSNSWGIRASLPSNGYYYYRQGTAGTGGVQFTNLNTTGGGSPKFLTNFEQSQIRVEFTDSSILSSGEELIDSGVIFVCSAGNSNQKLVSSASPDFNNYWSTSNNTPLSSATGNVFGYPTLNTINRQGFPGQIGKKINPDNSIKYRTIPIGALDSGYSANKERKASYSNTGDIVSVYCPGDNTIASSSIDGQIYQLYPILNNTYQVNNQSSIQSWEYSFGGTSSSCPVAAGLFATILENNRFWTYANVLNWIENKVGYLEETEFYYGFESDSVDSSYWDTHYSIQNGTARVLWDSPANLNNGLITNQFLSPEGDLTKYFLTESWILDQYVGDKLYTWGNNDLYQLGTNNTNNQTFPIETSVKGSSWKQVISGGFHNFALKTDNTLWAWGNNSFGQLGFGDFTQRQYPTQVSYEVFWKKISCGLTHSAAIKSNGTLSTWGRNEYGQLGLGNLTTTNIPTLINYDIDWRYVACGGFHTLAIKNDGTLWTCGKNTHGQLGLGDRENRSSFTQVGSDTDWKLVSAGREYSVAIKNNGSMWSWGMNRDTLNPPIFGLLGLGDLNTTVVTTPRQVGLDYSWKYIDCGGYHSAAIKNNNTLWMWGRNDYGQLGLDDTNIRDIPIEVVESQGAPSNIYSSSGWKQVSCGDMHTIGLRINATLWFWGSRYPGTSTNTIPTLELSSIYSLNWKQISAAYSHSSGVTSGSSPLYLIS